MQRYTSRKKHHAGIFQIKHRACRRNSSEVRQLQSELAITGNFEKYNSNSLKAFLLECNRGSQSYFVKDTEMAKTRLIFNKNIHVAKNS